MFDAGTADRHPHTKMELCAPPTVCLLRHVTRPLDLILHDPPLQSVPGEAASDSPLFVPVHVEDEAPERITAVLAHRPRRRR